jgi:hypothetical protein
VPVGEIGGVDEGVVEGDAPVHLRPVEDVTGDVLRMPHAGGRVE